MKFTHGAGSILYNHATNHFQIWIRTDLFHLQTVLFRFISGSRICKVCAKERQLKTVVETPLRESQVNISDKTSTTFAPKFPISRNNEKFLNNDWCLVSSCLRLEQEEESKREDRETAIHRWRRRKKGGETEEIRGISLSRDEIKRRNESYGVYAVFPRAARSTSKLWPPDYRNGQQGITSELPVDRSSASLSLSLSLFQTVVLKSHEIVIEMDEVGQIFDSRRKGLE